MLEEQLDSSLSRELTHVKAPSDTGTGQGLVLSILLADGHETRHLNLSEFDLATAEGSQRLHREVN